MSVLWAGEGVTAASMSQISYQQPGGKAPEGENKLARIVGTPWMASGLYPGWQSGEKILVEDPRDSDPDPRELGRGPLPEESGRFKALQLMEDGVRLEYVVEGAKIFEEVSSRIVEGERQIQRHFRVENTSKPLWLILGRTDPSKTVRLEITGKDERNGLIELSTEAHGFTKIQVKRGGQPVEFSVVVCGREGKDRTGSVGSETKWESKVRRSKVSHLHSNAPFLRWPERLTTTVRLSTNAFAFVVDEFELPLVNPWRRNVRLADLAFFKDGRAAGVTFDGDVWLISDLAGRKGAPGWKRFASGFHEPLGLCIRKGEIFVFDRNGIWRLCDADHNDEAERYELFSNEFAQTSETREFASGIRLAPDGSFVIAKGGQEKSFVGKVNGKILRVSSDGKRFTTLGWGLRQPFIGVNPRTGMVTASDQQGHYVPATPLHIIRDNQYYGFLPGFAPAEKYPSRIAEPLTWIPHAVNASGAGQVWLTDAQMGPLNEALIHIGYYRPELFVLRFNKRSAQEQAAVISITQQFEFAPLNGAVNPADGQLYVTGFQIWGTTAKQISGLARLRYTGAACTLPREAAALDKGVLLRFDVPLDPAKASNAANYSVERWNYKRTPNYGSPHFKLDGSLGQEWLTASSAYLSKDRKSVFVGVPDMKPSMQMRVGWALATERGNSFEQNAYLTPRELTKINLKAEGFEPVQIDLTPRARLRSATAITAVEGQKLASLMGCAACHSSDGTLIGKVGPTWKGLYGTERTFTKGEPAVADDDYLRQSMLEPTARIVKGFDKSDAGMPSYAGVLTDEQIRSLILYIQTLK